MKYTKSYAIPITLFLTLAEILTGCSGSNTNASGTGGSSSGGLTSSGAVVSVGGSGQGDVSTGGSTAQCASNGEFCQNLACCSGMYCDVGFCKLSSATSGSSGIGGAQSTGGSIATGGATSICGNGVIEIGETCDPPSSCPTTCPGVNACNAAKTIGSAATCDLFCAGLTPVTACISGDMCCPVACT
jgi:hypothetical protein